MRYQEPNKDLDSDITHLVEEEASFEEEIVPEEAGAEPLRKLKARPNNLPSLSARRAIEDHLERLRLRKEIDYLFDEDFNEEDK